MCECPDKGMTACGRPEEGNATGMLSGELVFVYGMTSSYKISPRQRPRRKSSNDSSGFSSPLMNGAIHRILPLVLLLYLLHLKIENFLSEE